VKLRFSIRDLLWLFVAAAIAGGWYLDNQWSKIKYNRLEAYTKSLERKLGIDPEK
jgi:hypothetical protein